MRRKRVVTIVAGIIFVSGLAPVRAASLVFNGSFDNTGGTFVNNTGLGSDDLQSPGATNIPSWANVPGFVNEFWATTPNSYSLTQSPGNNSAYWVDLTGEANNKPYGGIEQAISTAIGSTYTLTFDLGASTIYNGAGLAAAALTASATGAVLDASQEFTLVPSSTNQWLSETLTFTADAASTTIEFLADSAYTSRYTGLDNVSVQLVLSGPGGGGGVAVPEPASLALLALPLGVAGLMVARRRPNMNAM